MEPWLEQAMTGHNVIAEQAMFLRPKKVTPKEHLMNAALWIVQIVLAALYLMAGGYKLFGPGVGLEATMPGMSLGLIRLIGIIEGLAALGLLLPMVARNRMKIAMWAAVVLAIEAVLFVFYHLKHGANGPAVATLLLGLVAVFVASKRRG